MKLNLNSKIIVALDFDNIDDCIELIKITKDYVGVYKLGLEFYLAKGIDGVLQIQNMYPDLKIFLDLKLHDIPNTVKAAALAIAQVEPLFLTVHAAGGQKMIRAASDALPNTYVTAVTVLTSLNSDSLVEMGLPNDPERWAVQLASNAVEAGARAIVCSPLEVGKIRSAVGQNVVLITPGVRPTSSALDDQKRVMTPEEAVNAGADLLVIGRPITQSPDPRELAARIYRSLS